MNRKYNIEHYKNIVELLREYVKNVSITTDIIVGFPGETEEEFESTYNFLSEIKLSKMHIFKFSPRTGTKAAVLEEQVDGVIKEERSKALIKLNEENEKEFIQKFIGENLEVLYEGKYSNKDDFYEGYTPNYIKVISPSKEDLSSKIIETKILDAREDSALGEII
ncbi:Threonylcarbamoyladenosine tRNA methylthiotransferase MtaB [bioreactor metagenome]|uniref:Threonylcarbamoyladenosine tRNA methylthiotransferase MtaB n=1 Tax=bioreactor metagenome TaxID=1076179 RepID=A0A645GHU9_9ZZZZ